MGKVNYSKYDPRVDSSVGAEAYWAVEGEEAPEDNPGFYPSESVILLRDAGQCPCGCRETPKGGDRIFCMGHDARYRGKLIRAHVAGIEVVEAGNGGLTSGAAMTFAAQFGWESYLEAAGEREAGRRAAKIERANKEVLARAVGPRIGDRHLVKVGRWGYTGQVVAVWEDQGQVELEFVTKAGDIRRVIQGTDQLVPVAV